MDDTLQVRVIVDQSSVGPAFASVRSQVDGLTSGLNTASSAATALDAVKPSPAQLSNETFYCGEWESRLEILAA